MSMGNNVRDAEVSSASTTSCQYRRARLRCGATVREFASDSGVLVLQADDKSAWVTLCVDDAAALTEWVRVVVPGVGLAWVCSRDICEVESCPPSGLAIESLSIQFKNPPTEDQASAALEFVRLVGAKVTHLDITSCGFVDAETLRGVLLACPRLESLSVDHDGTVWSHGDVDGLPRLKELSMTLAAIRVADGRMGMEVRPFQRPSQRALQTCVRELSALRLHSLVECFEESKDNVCSALRGLRSLRYSHWCDSSYSYKRRATKQNLDEGLAFTYSSLGFDLPEDPNPTDQCGIEPKHHVALFSVISAKRGDSAVAKLSPDVLKQIFALAECHQPPELWVG